MTHIVIEGNSPSACSLDERIDTLCANLAILESARSGSWQRLDSYCTGSTPTREETLS
jgi:hypothetical protein